MRLFKALAAVQVALIGWVCQPATPLKAPVSHAAAVSAPSRYDSLSRKSEALRIVPRASRSFARVRLNSRQFACLDRLWSRESNWRPHAKNRRTGAYGIPQALPGHKMASAGKDWRTNPRTQIVWGLSYISKRYGTPCNALRFHNRHGWY